MDETDREIIEALLEKESSAHELAKSLFKTSDAWELRKRYSFLKYRLSKLAYDGLVRERENGAFYVPREDMILGKAKLVFESSLAAIDLGTVIYMEKGNERRVVNLEKIRKET